MHTETLIGRATGNHSRPLGEPVYLSAALCRVLATVVVLLVALPMAAQEEYETATEGRAMVAVRKTGFRLSLDRIAETAPAAWSTRGHDLQPNDDRVSRTPDPIWNG